MTMKHNSFARTRSIGLISSFFQEDGYQNTSGQYFKSDNMLSRSIKDNRATKTRSRIVTIDFKQGWATKTLQDIQASKVRLRNTNVSF